MSYSLLPVTQKNRCLQKKTTVTRNFEMNPYQQLLQEEPHELGCIPESTKP